MEHEVTHIEYWGRNAAGLAFAGVATFRDGKVWKWHRSAHDGAFYFTIDSGIPSQWSLGNYGRMVSYPKRVLALKKRLQQEDELYTKTPAARDTSQCVVARVGGA